MITGDDEDELGLISGWRQGWISAVTLTSRQAQTVTLPIPLQPGRDHIGHHL